MGSNNFQLTDIPAGNYSIQIIDSKGCEKVRTFVIDGDGGNLDFVLEITAASCGSKGSAWVTVSGGTPGHAVSIWGDNNIDESYQVGSNSFQLTDIPAGSYSIRIVDSKGCEKLQPFVIGNSGSDLSYTVSVTDAACGGKGSAPVSYTHLTLPTKA